MASGDLVLTVGGRAYEGWKRVHVTRGIEAIAGGFELGIVDRWFKQVEPWPILEEDECSVSLLGQQVITGWVDKRNLALESGSRTFTVSGRDKAGALVDCSADTGRLLFRNVPLIDVANKICSPFGITVKLQPGLIPPVIPPWDKLAINVGDKASAALEKACRMVGFLPISDGMGGILLARAGQLRATTALVSSENVLKASATYDFTGRYFKYQVLSAHAAKVPKKAVTKAAGKALAKANAAAARSRGEAFDEEVKRTERLLVINPEDGADKKYAQARAEWEAKVRAAKSEGVVVTVQGWAQETGQLWPVNALCEVDISEVGVSGEMLITQTKFGMSEGGRLTEITLKRPDAYSPEPRIRRSGTGGKWKELVGGV